MKNLLIVFFCTMCGVCYGQKADAEKYLKGLSEDYKAQTTQLVEATKILEELKSKITPTNSDPTVLNEVGGQMQKTREIQIKLDSINNAAQAAMTHYVIKEKLEFTVYSNVLTP